jgi:hypothetical protein
MPEYYSYLERSLNKLSKVAISEDEFMNIVMSPTIDLSQASKE